jgi:hypothetical protein
MSKIIVPDYLGQQVLSGLRTLHYDGEIIDIACKLNNDQKSKYRLDLVLNGNEDTLSN